MIVNRIEIKKFQFSPSRILSNQLPSDRRLLIGKVSVETGHYLTGGNDHFTKSPLHIQSFIYNTRRHLPEVTLRNMCQRG